MVRLRFYPLCILGREFTEVKPPSLHITSSQFTSKQLPLQVLKLTAWMKQCLAGFSTAKLLLFSCCALWKEVPVCSAHLRTAELCPPFLRVGHLFRTCSALLHRFVCSSSKVCLFNHSLVRVQAHRCSLTYGVIPQYPFIYVVAQTIAALAFGDPFIRLLCLFDMFPSMFMVVCLLLICLLYFTFQFWYYKMLQAHLIYLLLLESRLLVPAIGEYY